MVDTGMISSFVSKIVVEKRGHSLPNGRQQFVNSSIVIGDWVRQTVRIVRHSTVEFSTVFT
jgi:hypothetical protein